MVNVLSEFAQTVLEILEILPPKQEDPVKKNEFHRTLYCIRPETKIKNARPGIFICLLKKHNQRQS